MNAEQRKLEIAKALAIVLAVADVFKKLLEDLPDVDAGNLATEIHEAHGSLAGFVGACPRCRAQESCPHGLFLLNDCPECEDVN